jgi:stage V sporulation protein G
MSESKDFEVSRIYKLDSDSKLKAFVDISLGGLVVKGLRVVEGKDGLFVGMPRHQGKDGRWYDTVSATTKEFKQELSELILAAYQG